MKNITKEEETFKMIDSLCENIGKKISFEVWKDGRLNKYTDVLRYVNGILGFGTEKKYISFISPFSAVKEIKSTEGTSIYKNEFIKPGYGKQEEDVAMHIENMFGEREASIYRKKQELESLKNELIIKDKIADLEFKKNKYETIKEGYLYVQDNMKDKWEKFANKFINSGYSYSIVEKSIICMKAMKNGLGNEELYKLLNDCSSNVISSVLIAATISSFGQNGQEFQKLYTLK